MRNLQDILYKAGITEVNGTLDQNVRNIAFDSREVDNGDVFVAIKGFVSDGHFFIEKAIDLGAKVIVCEDLPKALNDKITYVVVPDASVALSVMASNFYDNPSKDIKLIYPSKINYFKKST